MATSNDEIKYNNEHDGLSSGINLTPGVNLEANAQVNINGGLELNGDLTPHPPLNGENSSQV